MVMTSGWGASPAPSVDMDRPFRGEMRGNSCCDRIPAPRRSGRTVDVTCGKAGNARQSVATGARVQFAGVVLTIAKEHTWLTSPQSPSTWTKKVLSLIHISEPTRLGMISYAVFCLKKK